MMINASINGTPTTSVRNHGSLAKNAKQSASVPSTRPQKRESYLQTVEAGYVLHEPEIQATKRRPVSHERRIL